MQPTARPNGPFAISNYDTLNRAIATDTQGFDGSTIRIATQYDVNLHVAQTSRPYFLSGGTAKWTVYTYDPLGRVTLATMPDASHLTNEYEGLTTLVTNDKGQITTTIKNPQGQIAFVKDALDASDPGNHTTSYLYDAFNSLTTITDPAGNVTSYTYDLLGRRTQAADPDMELGLCQ